MSTDGAQHESWSQNEALSAPSGDHLVRAKIGRYELVYEVAAGGMGSVYAALARGNAGFSKVVALKTIHRHLTHQREFVDMFIDEARIAGLLNHPNVCDVLDFGEDDGIWYLTMDYLVGEPYVRLLERVAELKGRAPRADRIPYYFAHLLSLAAEGLHAAHELRRPDGELMNVVHRDVSPQNLFVTYDGGLRVLDFGVASAAQRLHQTATGVIKGKWAYMAPEQIQGAPIDRRTDVWSLGVLFWESMARRRLFRRNTEPETALAVLQTPVPMLAERLGLPPEVDDIVVRAIARNPADRYGTARELARDLALFAGSAPVVPTTPEICEWIEELFPGSAQSKLSRLHASVAAKVEAPREAVGGTGRHASISSPAPSTVSTGAHVERTPVPRRSVRTQVPLAIALLVIAALGGALAWALWLREVPDARDAVVALPTSDVPPAAVPRDPPELPVAPARVETPIVPVVPVVDVADAGAAPIDAGAAPAVRSPGRPIRRPTKAPPVAGEEVPAPSEGARPAMLNIATVGGWAEVSVDGVRRGPTPMSLALSPGRHVVELRFEGAEPRRIPVELAPGETQRLRIAR